MGSLGVSLTFFFFFSHFWVVRSFEPAPPTLLDWGARRQPFEYGLFSLEYLPQTNSHLSFRKMLCSIYSRGFSFAWGGCGLAFFLWGFPHRYKLLIRTHTSRPPGSFLEYEGIMFFCDFHVEAAISSNPLSLRYVLSELGRLPGS